MDVSTCDRGKAGSLILMGTPVVNLTINDSNNKYSDCYYDYVFSCNSCRLVGVYVFLSHANKHLTCTIIISSFHNTNSLEDWIVCGDFNLIKSPNEKQGGSHISNNLANLFDNTIYYCNMNDIRYIGSIFTSSNNKKDNKLIQARLDRVLV